jgi:hypothetical protein
MPYITHHKGVYCIEGLWNHDNITDRSTVLPLLELLHNQGYCDHVYHDCATVPEIEYYINRWKEKAVKDKFPILYLAFHGAEGKIFVNHDLHYTLHQLAAVLRNQCKGKVIYFGSCSTLNIDMRLIKRFLKITGAIAVIGYKKDVDWIQSAACDLFVFEALQLDKLNNKGIRRIHKMIVENYGNLHKMLDLRVVINPEAI